MHAQLGGIHPHVAPFRACVGVSASHQAALVRCLGGASERHPSNHLPTPAVAARWERWRGPFLKAGRSQTLVVVLFVLCFVPAASTNAPCHIGTICVSVRAHHQSHTNVAHTSHAALASRTHASNNGGPHEPAAVQGRSGLGTWCEESRAAPSLGRESQSKVYCGASALVSCRGGLLCTCSCQSGSQHITWAWTLIQAWNRVAMPT